MSYAKVLEDPRDASPEVPPEIEASRVRGEDVIGTEVAPLIMDGVTTVRRQTRSCLSSGCRTVLRWLKFNLLLFLTIIAVISGVVIGLSIRNVDIPKESRGYALMIKLLSFPGEIFLRILKMLILPLIVFSLISGLGSLDTKTARSLCWKTVLYYMSTTLSAVILGMILVSTIQPGRRTGTLQCDNATSFSGGNNLDTLDSILDLIRYMSCSCMSKYVISIFL